MKPCRCGSGLDRRNLLDAAGIFCTFVCDRCEREAKQRFNPTIFISGTPYALSGEEQDLAGDDESDLEQED